MRFRYKHIIENEYLYSVFAKIFGVATGLIYSILYSRYLGTTLRGEAAIINNISYFGSIFMCLGIYQAYPFYRKRVEGDIKTYYVSFINNVFGLLILYSILAISGIVFLPLKINIKIALVMMPLMMGVKTLNYLVLIENPKLRNNTGIILNTIDIVIIFVLMLTTKASYFWCYLFLIIKEVIYFIIVLCNLKISLTEIKPNFTNIYKYIKFGIMPMITVILMEVNYKIDILMLEPHVSVAEIGIYSLGVQLAERLWLIPDALKDILLSKLSKGKSELEVAKVTRLSLIVMLICILLAVLLGKQVIIFLFGNEYSESYNIMLYILASVMGMVFYKMVYSYNVANGNKLINMLLLGIAAIINVILNILLIPMFGMIGAAVASLISYSMCGIMFLLYFINRTQIPIYKMLFIQKEDIVRLKNFFRH